MHHAQTPAEQKQMIIDDLAAARNTLLAVVRDLPPDSQDTPCIGTWTVKDLVAHLVGWDFTNLQAIKEILTGQRPSFFQYHDTDWRSYNAQLVETYRIEPLEALLESAAASHQQLVAFLQGLPPAVVLEGKSPKEQGRVITIRRLLNAEAQDERKHRDQVQAYRENLSL